VDLEDRATCIVHRQNVVKSFQVTAINPLLVRPATAADGSSISMIHAAAWREGYRGLMPDQALELRDVAARAAKWRSLIEAGGREVLVAVAGDRVVGFASVAPSRDADAMPFDRELTALYVEPTCWRRGAGRVLIETAVARARSRGWTRLTAWVLSSNVRGRAFYASQGFCQDGGDKIEGEPPLRQTRYSRPLISSPSDVEGGTNGDAPVHIVPYDAAWPDAFDREREVLAAALAPWLAGPIEHVGSTAVPGLVAKPVIDIAAAVRDLETSRPAIVELARLGYCYAPYRVDVMHWFCKPSASFRTHHLHLVPFRSQLWFDRLVFRDFLRAHAETATEYAALKQQLAAIHEFDREAYTDAKSPFVERVLATAKTRAP
jgi:GrpB-like predicted nucleotidyltransferase (UPF0157 family)/L-amino acid N-acyltransferase YncA